MARRKDYDDEEMVRLIARGELSCEAIAKRLGVSPQFVSEVATGKKRPDLQGKIHEAMREFIREAWKHGGVLPTEDGGPPPRPTSGRSKRYDEDLLVELLGTGELTYSQIAPRIGLTREMVWAIDTGRKRRDLQPRIRQARQHYRRQARSIGSKWTVQVVKKQIRIGLTDDGWLGLRARQDLMDRFLGPESDDDGAGYRSPEDLEADHGLADLPEPLKTQVIRALGGPED